MLLGCTGCMPRNTENKNQDQYTAENSSQGQSDTAKAHTTVTVEEALPDSLIARVVKNPGLQQELRELRKNPATIDKAAPGGHSITKRTVLQLAAIADELEVLKALLQAGSDPNVTIDSSMKQTALLDSTTHKHNEKAIQALLEAGADALHQGLFEGIQPYTMSQVGRM